jgi:hypothetical protein
MHPHLQVYFAKICITNDNSVIRHPVAIKAMGGIPLAAQPFTFINKLFSLPLKSAPNNLFAI